MIEEIISGEHTPVLKEELIAGLNLKAGDKVMDCTLGLGGHAEEVLKIIGEKGLLIGMDVDEQNLEKAKERLKEYKNFVAFRSNFENLTEVLEEEGIKELDAIYFDLGLSSPHVDEPERGFSFSRDGPLDMRFDKRLKLTAADLINELNDKRLEEIFRKYGEIIKTHKLVNEIIRERKIKKIDSTLRLAQIIKNLSTEREQNKMLMKVFMALRIAVNKELEVLEKALKSALQVLKIGGRIAVISYHSLEDRMVKNFFREAERECMCPREVLICNCGKKREVKVINRKPITPTEEEISKNRRSRSGRLRIAGKIFN